VASRVLLPLGRYPVDTAVDWYQAVHAIRWTDHLGPEQTLAVSVAGANSPVGPSHFVALKTKDAIVDRVREQTGARPSVDKQRPDLRVHVFLSPTASSLSLDLAGQPLHRRGLARDRALAPLKENLAAAVLRLAGWHGQAARTALYDPLCGTGTLLLEAAGMALDRAPGLDRGRLGAEGWRGHDRGLWRRLLAEAAERRVAGGERELRIAGSDASPQAVRRARELVKRADLAGRIQIERGELRDALPPFDEPGLVVTNPPYGERLGEAGELGPLYRLLGDVLKQRFAGWKAWVLSGNRALEKQIGLRPASRHGLFNGAIPCRLLEIPIASTPLRSNLGPGWRRARSDQARGFARTLRTNLKRLAPWAKREGVDCYRIYDADMGIYNLAVDRYAEAVRVEEYARPKKVSAEDAQRRLNEALMVVSEVLEVEPAQVALRVRRRLGKHEQHGRFADRGRFLEVREGELRFRVNLGDYLDTGLYLDDRLLRRLIRGQAAGGDFLNLFAYTCTASVAAAAGGARSTTSVDLSRTYLDWGRRNLALNRLEGPEHRFLRDDVLRFLKQEGRRWDLVFAAPPSRSRSKAMAGEFDVQRDHLRLLQAAGRRLKPGGRLLFTTNLRGFSLQATQPAGLKTREITAEVTPRDFERRPRLRAWEMIRECPR
jgi:23S rRNA (guanine2445-N2)-methyltransferase / 23S rRNA (guanine2069-N7)-methyltransferase